MKQPTRDNLQRVVVIGGSCAGKTTLARDLSRILQVPHIEMDALHWKADWISTLGEELRPLVQNATDAPCWVLDGNYSVVRDMVWARATTIIWLNYPFRIVLWRALKRTFGRVVSRQTLWNGNRETWRRTFSRDSILWWVVKTYRRRYHEYPQLLQQAPAHLHLETFASPQHAARWLQLVQKR